MMKRSEVLLLQDKGVVKHVLPQVEKPVKLTFLSQHLCLHCEILSVIRGVYLEIVRVEKPALFCH
jgi:hypothetical protein